MLQVYGNGSLAPTVVTLGLPAQCFGTALNYTDLYTVLVSLLSYSLAQTVRGLLRNKVAYRERATFGKFLSRDQLTARLVQWIR
jgi:hypothetical protein